jgi:choline dehydrogenase-like flavoprotein
MISDLNSHRDGEVFKADICIVGAGAAGLALAVELLNSPWRVLILESGGWADEPDTQSLYESTVTGLPFAGVHTGRFRIMGGSTTRWAGQSLPFTPIDFETRPWVPHSGWPIRIETLRPYYDRANRFLLVDTLNYDTDLLTRLRTEPPSFESEKLTYHFAKWSLQPDLRRVYRRDLESASNIRVLLHANVTDLALDEFGVRIDRAQIASLQGRRGVAHATHFVLCVGGIETARLLLACRRQRPAGLGNEHDLVGRFFQDHPAAEIGFVETDDYDQIQRLFNLFHRGRRKYSVRFSLGESFQRARKLLNASGCIMFSAGPDSPYETLRQAYHLVRKRQFGQELWRAGSNCAVHAAAVARPVWEYIVKRRTYTPDALFAVNIITEQEPNPESRVLLSDRLDALGMPRGEIRWRLTDLTLRTAQTFAEVAREQFARARLGLIKLHPWLIDPGVKWRNHFTDQNHHIGTARMGDSPYTGVVDANCRLHSVENLMLQAAQCYPLGDTPIQL